MVAVWAWGKAACQGNVQEPAADEPTPEARTAATEKEAREPLYDVKANARVAIEKALKIAKRDNKRVLLNFGGNWCKWCYKLHDLLTRHDLVAPLIDEEYVLVMVDVNANRPLFESYGKNNAQHGVPFLTVLDADGKLLVNQNAGDLDDGTQHDAKKVAAFLRKWVASKKHADDLLQAALAEARKSDKCVLLHLGAAACGWCQRLSELLGELQTDLNRDYVIVKIDSARMTGGEALAEILRMREANNPSGGIPWMVVLDAEGKQLITSDAAQGNIGCPVLDWEVEHFLMMLDYTCQSLGTDDLARLRQTVERFTEKWRPEPTERR
jgi:thiol-disulfide isomerase/thioredoxin